MKKVISTVLEGYSPLKIRNLRIYLAGQAISLVGTWMQATAQSWVVWDLSHSVLQLGIVSMLGFIAFLILGPWTGVWADRLNRRKLLIGTQVSALILAIIFAILVQINLIKIWHIYILSTLLGIVNSLDMPAQQAFIGDLAGMEQIRKAVVINSAIIQISRMAGPAMAGWMIAAAGVAPAFWINGLSFIAVIITLMMVTSHQVIHPKSGNHLNEFKEGIDFIRNNPRILDLMILTLLLTFFGFSIIQIMPAIATDVLKGHSEVLGLLLGASGAGALIGATLFVPIFAKFKRIGVVVTSAVVYTGFCFILFSLSKNLYISTFIIFMSGLFAPVIFTTTNGLLQIFAPPHMRARVLSVLLMVTFGVQPIASLFIGLTGHFVGPEMAILLNGVIMIVGSLLMLFFRSELMKWELGILTKQST